MSKRQLLPDQAHQRLYFAKPGHHVQHESHALVLLAARDSMLLVGAEIYLTL